MLTGAKFVKAIEDSCEAALVRHGFRRLRRGSIVFEISKDFFGWIGLNVGSHGDYVRINPFVGIHCVPLMKFVAETSGEKYKLGNIATFAVHLGELCPDVGAFEFSAEKDLDPESERLAATMRQYGVPYMEAHANYESLLPILEERVPTLGGYPQRMAAALYLVGCREQARQFVVARRAEYEEEGPMVRESFDRFALPFLKLLDRPPEPFTPGSSR